MGDSARATETETDMSTTPKTIDPKRADFIASIITTAAEGGSIQFEFKNYNWTAASEKDGSGLQSAYADVRDLERQHPKNWQPLSMAKVEKALKKFQAADASEKLHLHDSYINTINGANRTSAAYLIDAELADYIVQVAINGEVMFS